MAEIELSVLSRQCLSRRIPDTLKREVQAWQDRRNQQRATVGDLLTKMPVSNLKHYTL